MFLSNISNLITKAKIFNNNQVKTRSRSLLSGSLQMQIWVNIIKTFDMILNTYDRHFNQFYYNLEWTFISILVTQDFDKSLTFCLGLGLTGLMWIQSCCHDVRQWAGISGPLTLTCSMPRREIEIINMNEPYLWRLHAREILLLIILSMENEQIPC